MAWYEVALRTGKVGIRRAVGATRPKILGMFIRRGLSLISIGVLLGLGLGGGAASVIALRSGWSLYFS
ncbi:MAG: FtsX-like permease family protein [Candidatus Bipolaricaulaceae bacterium]